MPSVLIISITCVLNIVFNFVKASEFNLSCKLNNPEIVDNTDAIVVLSSDFIEFAFSDNIRIASVKSFEPSSFKSISEPLSGETLFIVFCVLSEFNISGKIVP